MSDAKLVWLAVFVATLVGFFFGKFREAQLNEREAVRRGHATWAVGVDGGSRFQWKEDAK